jgi:hypothetical protein
MLGESSLMIESSVSTKESAAAGVSQRFEKMLG